MLLSVSPTPGAKPCRSCCSRQRGCRSCVYPLCSPGGVGRSTAAARPAGTTACCWVAFLSSHSAGAGVRVNVWESDVLTCMQWMAHRVFARFLPTLGFCCLCGNQEGCSRSPHLCGTSICLQEHVLVCIHAALLAPVHRMHNTSLTALAFIHSLVSFCFYPLQQRNFRFAICTQSPRRRRPQAEQLCCCRGVVSPGPFIWH